MECVDIISVDTIVSYKRRGITPYAMYAALYVLFM